MVPVLFKIMTIQLLRKSILILLQQILWTCCVFLSSVNDTFFRLIFSIMNYFCYNYTNIFFIHTTNYFSVVLRIIFLMCIENYVFIGSRIIFRGIANLFFSLQCIAGFAVEGNWFECLISLATILKNVTSEGVPSAKRMQKRNIVRERNEKDFHLLVQNLRGARSLCESDEVF